MVHKKPHAQALFSNSRPWPIVHAFYRVHSSHAGQFPEYPALSLSVNPTLTESWRLWQCRTAHARR
jgi:hypothetical protein